MQNLAPFIQKALIRGSLRIHTNKKNLLRQHFYKFLRLNNIKTLRIIEGPKDELWLLRKSATPEEEEQE